MGLTPILKENFPDTIPVARPIVELNKYTEDWITGFVSGDGGFGCYARKKKVPSTSSLYEFTFGFYITQHIRDTELMKTFQEFFNCGIISYDRNTVLFRVRNFNQIYNIIIPFFTKHKVLGLKSLNYLDWVKAAEIVRNKEHLTLEGNQKVIEIIKQMNSKRLISYK